MKRVLFLLKYVYLIHKKQSSSFFSTLKLTAKPGQDMIRMPEPRLSSLRKLCLVTRSQVTHPDIF